MTIKRVLLAFAAAAPAIYMTSGPAMAVPVAGQIIPVGVYLNTNGVFGLAYDSVNNIIHYSQGDSGDNLVHTVKAFKNYTAAELAALPLVNGIPSLSLLASLHDDAGTTNPGVFGGSAHFSALAFDAATGKLVQSSGGDVRSYFPFTALGDTMIPSVGSGFADGLDFDGANRWFSPDGGAIFNNGVLFISNGDSSKTLLPVWTGLGSEFTSGWAGVEQVGDSLFAVAIQSFSDTGRSRTIVRFDALTGELLGFDPDGDPVAARWEDLAFDGQFLYAADLRGNADADRVFGDIYVFAVTGGLDAEPPTGVPEPATLGFLGLGLVGLAALRRRKSA